jgi:hydrogenase maturation protease
MTFSTVDSTASPLLIAGLGSPHGDDQAGWIALERLRPRLPSGINLQRLTLPIDLLSHLGSPQVLLIIDAAAPAGGPGAWRHFSWPCRDFISPTAWCTHGLGLVETLRLAETLGSLPSRVDLYTIEAATIAPLAALSPSVSAGLDALVDVLAAMMQHL